MRTLGTTLAVSLLASSLFGSVAAAPVVAADAGPSTRPADSAAPPAEVPSPAPTPAALPPRPTVDRGPLGTPASVKPPSPYRPERWEEDYRYLKDPAARTDYLDPIKYVPLNAAGDWYLSFGGHLRERYEFFNNYRFGGDTQDDNGYWLTRVFAHVDAHLGPNFRVFLEAKSGMVDNRDGGPRGTDADEFDMQQGFVELILPLGGNPGGPGDAGGKNQVSVRAGRQELTFGAERLIGLSNWSDNRRTNEGVRVTWAAGDNTLDAFLVRPEIFDVEEPDDGDRHNAFWGVYDTIRLPGLLPKANSLLDVYGLVLNRTKGGPTNLTSTGNVDSDTYTVGFRFATKPKPWDVEVEADYQFGTAGEGSISAYSVATDVGYTLADAPFSPRANLGFDVASGDRSASDPDTQTFNQLFPSGHTYLGFIDNIGRQNVIDLHPGVQLSLLKNARLAQNLALKADYHLFWRQSTADAVYTTSGSALRRDSGSDDAFVGSEVDVLLNWQVDRHLSSYVGYSHFWPGAFIGDTGAHQPTDFFYVAVQYDF